MVIAFQITRGDTSAASHSVKLRNYVPGALDKLSYNNFHYWIANGRLAHHPHENTFNL